MQLGVGGLGRMGGNTVSSDREAVDRIDPTLQSLAPEIGAKPMTPRAADAARRDMIPLPGMRLRARRRASTR